MENNMARKLNILVVDDDRSTVHVLKRIIESRLSDKFFVHGISESSEALAWLDEHCCDILISDVEMPDFNGLQMLRYAKRRNAWTQVIFITAHTSWEKLTEAVEFGASDYLLKPIDSNEMVAVLNQHYVRCARWQTAVLGTLEAALG
jgi:YesN/AraC family two-component response regulator